MIEYILMKEFRIELSLITGLLFAITIAIISKYLSLLLPQLGSATIAILLGILMGNLLEQRINIERGTKIAESKFLEISVMLLGFNVTFQTLAQLGFKSLLFVIILMSLTIIFTSLIGKKLNFNLSSRLLMAGGNAICGSSAIASLSPLVKASSNEKGEIITLVNLQGTIMMLSLPFLAIYLFADNTISTSALLGGTLQSVGQVVAAASFINNSVVEYAMLFKIIRIALLVLVAIIFRQITNPISKQESLSTPKRILPLPWYLLAFLIVCTLHSILVIPQYITQITQHISSWLEITALAAIGLRLNLRNFLQKGKRFLLYALYTGLLQVSIALTLIFLLKL